MEGSFTEIKITDNSGKVKEELEAAVKKALTACGLTAQSYAKNLCPVDTGNLRNSLTYEVDEDEQAAYIGTNVEYASFVEFGTYKQKAQPYLEPAVADHTQEYEQLIKKAMS